MTSQTVISYPTVTGAIVSIVVVEDPFPGPWGAVFVELRTHLKTWVTCNGCGRTEPAGGGYYPTFTSPVTLTRNLIEIARPAAKDHALSCQVKPRTTA